MKKIIGIGDYAVSSSEKDTIKTFALGSCIALVIYCPDTKKLGMVHIALPDSAIVRDKACKSKEGYFADIAVPMLFNKVCGGFINYKKDYRVSIFGGALSNNKKDVFNVGQKNLMKIKEILTNNNVSFDFSNTGGNYSRTIEVDVNTGTPIINKQPINI
jgi:chemotaxis protein CheD